MITTKYGTIQGVDHGDCLEYRKVPYAKPPVGELRFAAPQKPDAWEGVLDCTAYAPKCMQADGSTAPWDRDFYSDHSFDRKSSEDCLYLNIWTPRKAEGCPVALWIHGGAFLGGYSTELEFDGAAYAKRGVILVSVEYRCNIFGFLAHPWLTAEDAHHSSGNYGILDQIAALDWVYENISAFGGDPSNITVFGQSAGAMSTQTLISSPLTRGKIAKAILQSGGSYGKGLHRNMPLATAEHYGQYLPDILGVHSLEELRALDADTVYAAMGPFMEKVMPEAKGLFLTPVIDNYVLTDGYYALMEQEQIADIPYMLGSTSNDIDIMQENRTDDRVTMLYDGCLLFSRELEEIGRKPAYVYYFTRSLPGDGWGAFHSAELFYTFDTLDRTWRPWEDHDHQLCSQIMDYWTNFMKKGDPNGEALPEWKACGRAEDYFVKELN